MKARIFLVTLIFWGCLLLWSEDKPVLFILRDVSGSMINNDTMNARDELIKDIISCDQIRNVEKYIISFGSIADKIKSADKNNVESIFGQTNEYYLGIKTTGLCSAIDSILCSEKNIEGNVLLIITDKQLNDEDVPLFNGNKITKKTYLGHLSHAIKQLDNQKVCIFLIQLNCNTKVDGYKPEFNNEANSRTCLTIQTPPYLQNTKKASEESLINLIQSDEYYSFKSILVDRFSKGDEILIFSDTTPPPISNYTTHLPQLLDTLKEINIPITASPTEIVFTKPEMNASSSQSNKVELLILPESFYVNPSNNNVNVALSSKIDEYNKTKNTDKSFADLNYFIKTMESVELNNTSSDLDTFYKKFIDNTPNDQDLFKYPTFLPIDWFNNKIKNQILINLNLKISEYNKKSKKGQKGQKERFDTLYKFFKEIQERNDYNDPLLIKNGQWDTLSSCFENYTDANNVIVAKKINLLLTTKTNTTNVSDSLKLYYDKFPYSLPQVLSEYLGREIEREIENDLCLKNLVTDPNTKNYEDIEFESLKLKNLKDDLPLVLAEIIKNRFEQDMITIFIERIYKKTKDDPNFKDFLKDYMPLCMQWFDDRFNIDSNNPVISSVISNQSLNLLKKAYIADMENSIRNLADEAICVSTTESSEYKFLITSGLTLKFIYLFTATNSIKDSFFEIKNNLSINVYNRNIVLENLELVESFINLSLKLQKPPYNDLPKQTFTLATWKILNDEKISNFYNSKVYSRVMSDLYYHISQAINILNELNTNNIDLDKNTRLALQIEAVKHIAFAPVVVSFLINDNTKKNFDLQMYNEFIIYYNNTVNLFETLSKQEYSQAAILSIPLMKSVFYSSLKSKLGSSSNTNIEFKNYNNLYTFVSVCGGVAEAKNKEAMKQILTQNLLPPTTHNTKTAKKPSFSSQLFFNAYLGAFLGVEQSKVLTGIYCPLGIEWSFCPAYFKDKCRLPNMGIMLSFIDLGNIYSYRIKENKENNTNLNNFIAPGLSLTFPICSIPFSINAGYEFIPNYRFNDENSKNTHRGFLSIAYDFPMFRLY